MKTIIFGFILITVANMAYGQMFDQTSYGDFAIVTILHPHNSGQTIAEDLHSMPETKMHSLSATQENAMHHVLNKYNHRAGNTYLMFLTQGMQFDGRWIPLILITVVIEYTSNNRFSYWAFTQ